MRPFAFSGRDKEWTIPILGVNPMSDPTPNLEAIVRRMERLERQNHRLKRIGLCLLVITGATFWMGQARAPRIQEATKFVLKDVKGRNRAELGMHPEGAALVFLDSAGNSALSVGIHEEGPGMILLDSRERRIAALSSTATGPILTLYDANGMKRLNLSVTGQGPALGLLGTGGEAKGAFGMTRNETCFLQLFGSHEHGGAQLFATADRATLRFLDSSDKTRAAFGLLEKEGSPGLTINDSNATARILLMMLPEGPLLNTLDQNKKVTWSAP